MAVGQLLKGWDGCGSAAVRVGWLWVSCCKGGSAVERVGWLWVSCCKGGMAVGQLL